MHTRLTPPSRQPRSWLRTKPRARLRVRRLVAAAATLCLGASATLPAAATASSPTASSPKQSLVNEQLVVAELGPSGLPKNSELINRIVATGFDQQSIAVETSTNRLRYLDQTGAPELDGHKVLYPIGGQSQSTVTSIADFEKPLPIALHAEYATVGAGNRGVNPKDIPGKSGDLDVTYTVTNTTVKRESVSYYTADGSQKAKELPVFAPFVGVLQATLPADIEVTKTGDAVVGTSESGQTTLTWNLVLYPPIGSYEQRMGFSVSSPALTIPGVAMEVMPIANDQSPATAFASKLLTESVSGNSSMIEGLGKVNAALVELGSSASQLANGGSEISSGSSQLASGIGTAKNGAQGLSVGSEALTQGLNQLAGGLDQLAGSNGLAASVTGTEQIAKSVQQIATKIGGPWNKPLPEPLPDPLPANITLYQILEVLQRGSGIVAQLSAQVALALTEGAVEANGIGIDAKAAQDDADDATSLLDDLLDELCPGGVPSGITSDQCANLEGAKDKTGLASDHADSAHSRAETLDGKLATAGAQAATVATATELTHRVMPLVLNQVTALSLSLDSRDPDKAGIYQSLMALRGALQRASLAADQFGTGVHESANGSNALAAGSDELILGLGALAGGANQLARGAEQLAHGAGNLATGSEQLSSEGTERMIAEINKASQTPGLADAYLKAASNRANEAAPYPTPADGVSHVAYVYSMEPVSGEQSSPAVVVGILGLITLGAGILAYRRIRTAPTA